MNNIIDINGYKAVVSFDPEINMFRGEFVSLSGGADFYSDTVSGLHEEARRSLHIYLEMCKEKGIKPQKAFSGRLNIRLDPATHKAAAIAARAAHESLNEWAGKLIQKAVGC